MGGSGIAIKIEPTGADDAMSPAEFHKLLWRNWLRPLIGNRLRRAANRQVLADYLDSEASDGFFDGGWISQPDMLVFAFHDGGGCSMSLHASLHWTEWAFALTHESRPDFVLWAKACGFRFVAPPPLDALMAAGPHYPLIELRRMLYGIATTRKGGRASVEIFTDEGAGPLTYETLKADERARVDAIARTRQCECELCGYVRERRAKPSASATAKKGAAKKGAAKKGAAKPAATKRTGKS